MQHSFHVSLPVFLAVLSYVFFNVVNLKNKTETVFALSGLEKEILLMIFFPEAAIMLSFFNHLCLFSLPPSSPPPSQMARCAEKEEKEQPVLSEEHVR